MKSPVASNFILACLLALIQAGPALAEPYQAQAPAAELGQVRVALTGPDLFVRIDGLDRHLDDILLATQSPAAAVLAIYAEPTAWKKFNARPSVTDGRSGLNGHALISTPAPMADRVITVADFAKIKKDLRDNLQNAVGQKRRLDGELAGVSDHQVESALGLMEAFEVLEESPTFLTYRLTSSLELKLKKTKQPRRSRTVALSSTLFVGGKIINLQLVSDDPQPWPPARLEEIARHWRAAFLDRNTSLK